MLVGGERRIAESVSDVLGKQPPPRRLVLELRPLKDTQRSPGCSAQHRAQGHVQTLLSYL